MGGTPFFSKNGWPFVIISLGAILRGLFYLPAFSGLQAPAGLDFVMGSSPLMFGVYCTFWMAAGVFGVVSAVRGNRLVAISAITGLCAVWSLGYFAQFVHDVSVGNLAAPLTYLGGLTYASFGAAVFRYPARG